MFLPYTFSDGIPAIKWFGKEGGFRILVMDLMGLSLEDLFTFCGNQFSLKTVLMIADQMITRLEFMHSRSYIHRDVKPDNFLIGVGVRQVCTMLHCLCDFFTAPITSMWRCACSM